MTFDPDSYDMDAELERVAHIWIKNYKDFNWDWGTTQAEIEATFLERLENWKKDLERKLANVKKVIATRAEWIEKYNYRPGEITDANWHSWSWGASVDSSLFMAEDIGDTPTLLLGVKDGPIEFHPHCPYPPRKYMSQTGGLACMHPHLHGVELPLTDKAFRFAVGLERRWLDSNLTNWNPISLDCIIEYRAQLQEFGVDCAHSFPEFHEAWYPVDLRYLPLLTDIGVEPEEDAVLDWIGEVIAPHPYHEFLGKPAPWGRDWQVIICGENSD